MKKEMENQWRNHKSIAIAMLVLSLTPPSTGLSFESCYAGCFVLCAIQPTRTFSSCGFECLVNCLIPQTHNNNNNNNNNNNGSNHSMLATTLKFCNLGCAAFRCTNISTLENPRGKEVAGCVGSCSGLCTKNYVRAR